MTILYQLLSGSSLASEITGEVRKGLRPTGSKLEDVVINSLPMNNEQLQQCVANVNIYVPSIITEENDVQSEKPDYKRLEELTDMAVGILKVRESRNYYFDVQQVSQPSKDAESKSYFINIRVDFYAFNIN